MSDDIVRDIREAARKIAEGPLEQGTRYYVMHRRDVDRLVADGYLDFDESLGYWRGTGDYAGVVVQTPESIG